MTKETLVKMNDWLSLYSDSTHPLDEQRFFDFVREACLHKDEISETELKRALIEFHPEWNDTKVGRFIDEKMMMIECLMGFYDFCISNVSIDEEENEIWNTDSLQNFMEAVGDLNYHEIYELVQAIEGNADALTFFEVSDKGDTRTINYVVFNISFKFPLSDVDKLVAWLEDNYMDGLDADSWYGFQYAMERSKDV
uniref:hypothetical protein n=1 Tax=Alloprevotella sp. TaxID=1872471 RepID=UPI003FED6757